MAAGTELKALNEIGRGNFPKVMEIQLIERWGWCTLGMRGCAVTPGRVKYHWIYYSGEP